MCDDLSTSRGEGRAQYVDSGQRLVSFFSLAFMLTVESTDDETETLTRKVCKFYGKRAYRS